jgi:potassium-dependent mechanosensitive channel
MWWKKLTYVALAAIATLIVLVLNIDSVLTQSDLDPFITNPKFEDLNIYTDPSIPKAPVVIDGRSIFSVSKVGANTAGERANSIQKELLEAIQSDNYTGVKIEEQERLPVLYLEFKQQSQNELDEFGQSIPSEERRYLFTVTKEDVIEQELHSETARDLKREIEVAIAQGKRERSSAYIQRQGIISAVLLIVTLLGTRLLDKLQTYPLRQAIQKIIPGLPSNTSAQPSNLTTLFRLKLGFAQFALWIVTIFIIFRLFPWTRHLLYLFYSIVGISFNKSVFNFGGDDFSIIELIIFVALLIASIIGSNYVADLLRTKVLQVTRMTRGSQEIISIITKYGLIALAVVVLLQAYGLNLSSLALIGSALGVGIGFGLQDIARNFASGIVLLFERSVQVGDFIQVGNHLGVVEEIRTRSIVLKTLDRISIIVPNSRLLSEEVINWNHRRNVSRLHLPIGVAYGSDVKKVKSALLQAAEEHLEVLRNPPPQVFFTEFGDSSLNFELLVWTSDPSRQAPLTSDLCFRIEEIFREQQISIPFPQRDINISPDGLPIRLSPQLEGHLLYLLKGLVSQQYANNLGNNNQGTGKRK